jgi:hypothetical protein
MTNPITEALDRAADACMQIAEQQSKPWPESRHEPAVLCSTTLPEHKYQEQAQLCRQVAMQCAEAVRKVRREMWENCHDAEAYEATMKQVAITPTQPQGDVIERMLDAADSVHSLDTWRSYCADDRTRFYKAMTAAAKVLLDEALGPVTGGERQVLDASWDRHVEIEKFSRDRACTVFGELIAARRARLMPESKPDPAERAHKFYVSDQGWCVVVDRNRDHPLTAYRMESKVADAYYVQVCAQLKAGQQ